MRQFPLLLMLLFLAACASAPPPDIGKVVIAKSDRLLILVGPDGLPIKTYPIALGPEPVGPKMWEGDGRTPEGLYTISTRNPQSAYHLSLKVNYPNTADRMRATVMGVPPGGDIFIHGVPNRVGYWEGRGYRHKPNWTLGCIALSNRDIEELYRWIPDDTPVLILP